MKYITCRQLIGFLDDYLAGELAPEELYEFERHLAVCPSCVAYLQSYRETIHLTHAAAISDSPIDALPPDLLTAILTTVTRNTTH